MFVRGSIRVTQQNSLSHLRPQPPRGRSSSSAARFLSNHPHPAFIISRLCFFSHFVILIFFRVICVLFRSDLQFVLNSRNPCESEVHSLSLSADSGLAHAMRRNGCLRTLCSSTALVCYHWQSVVACGAPHFQDRV